VRAGGGKKPFPLHVFLERAHALFDIVVSDGDLHSVHLVVVAQPSCPAMIAWSSARVSRQGSDLWFVSVTLKLSRGFGAAGGATTSALFN